MLNDILKKRFTCRQWDRSREVPFELIQGILQDVYDSPRKNGDASVVVKVLTPSEEGERLKDELLKVTWCRDGDKGALDNTGPIRIQGQLTAPYVFLFGTVNEVHYNVHHVANATLQTTTAMISAEEKGLNTGYCQCVEPKEVLTTDINFYAMSLLGIGYGETPSNHPEPYSINKVTILEGERHYDMTNVVPGHPYFDEREKPPMPDMSIIV
jgi:hypothetical protein